MCLRRLLHTASVVTHLVLPKDLPHLPLPHLFALSMRNSDLLLPPMRNKRAQRCTEEAAA